jgi:hypothetical protein
MAVSNLKLRAGYEVGNQSIGDNARFGLYETRYGPNQNVYPDFLIFIIMWVLLMI